MFQRAVMSKPTPLPRFRSYRDVTRSCAHIIRPKPHMAGSAWASRYLNYDFGALPWHAELLDALTDPMTAEVALIGPSQIGKSEIGLSWMGYCVERDPGPFMFCQQSRNDADDFEKRRLKPFIRKHRVIRECLLDDNNSDNVHLKQFRGMVLSLGWPVTSYFTARPVRYGWLDDFDQFPRDIGGTEKESGQGDAWGLLDGRMPSFEGREVKFASSSPAREDESGIEALVVDSTDERLQPVCPSCGDRVEFDTIRDLKFERGTSKEAAESAYVECPKNGCVLVPEDKFKLFASLATLPNKGFVAANPSHGGRRRGFRIDGLFGMRSWSEIARKWREAEIAFETRQDESKLRTFFNTVAGKNYRSRFSGEKPIDPKGLLDRRESGWKLGTVPRGPKVLNIVVDAQVDRFECAAIGTAADRETWLIDRWTVHVLDDGLTGVQPFVHKEHWKVLLPYFDRKYPMVDGERIVGYAPVLSIAVDTGGSDKAGDQSTEGAKFFWNAAVALGINATRITLLKGGSNVAAKLMPPGQFADQKAKGGVRRRSARLWIPNVHKIKNMIDARLRRTTPGPGYVHLPEDLSEEHILEITAEEMKDGKWKKLRARNETLDHLVYGEAALLKPPFAQSQTHMRWIPKGFGILWPKKSANGEPVKPVQAPLQDQNTAKPASRRRPAKRPGAKSWMGRLK